MYKDQPLFSEVENYLRRMGFRLLDFCRYRLRRLCFNKRGQCLRGQTFFLIDVILACELRSPKLCLYCIANDIRGSHSTYFL